jgi:hypothetical protein
MSNETTITAQPVTIVLNTRSSDPDFNGDCDYAVVELKPALIDQIRRRVELARQASSQDNDLYEMYFWGGNAEFYDNDLLEACEKAAATDEAAQEWTAGLERNGHALMPVAADLSACQPQRVECLQMIVRSSPPSQSPEYEIAWTVIPKHSDVYVTTCDLPLAALEGYVGN